MLNNFIQKALSVSARKEFFIAKEKLKEFPVSSLKEETDKFLTVNFIQLFFHLNENEFREAVELVPEIEDGLRRFGHLIDQSRLLTLYYNISIAYFLLEQYDKALVWVKRIIDSKMDSRQDIQHFARILHLILHYETSPPQVVEYIYRMSIYYLYKYGRINAFEKTILRFIKKFSTIPDRYTLRQMLGELHEELRGLQEENDQTLGLAELSFWIESKLQRKPIIDIIRSKPRPEPHGQKP